MALDPSVEVNLASDAQARSLAQQVFDRPLVLEAGAGTGKTTILTARIIAWCMGQGWVQSRGYTEHPFEPEQLAARVLDGVVAITFTESAAAEMATRVAEALANIENGHLPQSLLPEGLPESQREGRIRSRALLCALDHLKVSTIHAFCLRLLADHPLEAGLHPNFIVDAEGLVLDELIREVVEDRLGEAYSWPGNPHCLALAAHGLGPQEIADALEVLAEAAWPPQRLEMDPFSQKRVAELISELHEAVISFQMLVVEVSTRVSKRAPLTQRTLENIEATLSHLEELQETGIRDIQALRERVKDLWSEEAFHRLKDWERGNFIKSERDLFGSLVDSVSERAGPIARLIEHVDGTDPEFLNHARLAIKPLLEEVLARMRARGAETFNSLLTHAQGLLADHPPVLRHARHHIHQLLVDEFQDTDRLQCDIIRMIALQGPREQRPGLFIVGDPKQSIYAWRNANPKAYDDFVDQVRREGGELLRLTVNFRSAPTILQEVQRVIAPVMHEQKGLQPAFEPLIPCPDRAEDKGFVQQSWVPVEYWISWVSDEENPLNFKSTRSAEAVELEACALARDIVRLNREQNVAFRDIAVLFRSTGDMDRYLTAFRESGIPYAVSRDKNYYRRREIIEATALVRCILDPNDHLALLTLMRSPTVGVPDAALIPLWTRSFPAVVTELHGVDPDQIQCLRMLLNEVVDTLPEGMPGLERVQGWEKNLLAAIRNLALLRESLEREPFDIFVERVRTHFLVEATEAARYLGPFRLANLERFFHGLIDTVEEAGGDTQMILRSLRAGVAQLREAEEGRPKEAAEDAVQVMTIHKAKGLDFKHVYVMQLHRGARSDNPTTTAGAIGEGSCDYTLFGTCTPGYMKVREHRTAVQTAELVRTLYVAMTRAKDRLVLAGNWPFMMTRRAPSKAKTHMDLLQWRSPSPPRLMDLMQQVRKSSKASWIDHAETRWFLPSAAQNGNTEITPLEMMADFPSVEQISAEAATLASRVQASRTHAARPYTGAASQESHEALQELSLQHPAVQDPSDDKQRLAMAVGSALHFVLEAFDLNAELIVEVERQRARLDTHLRLLLSPHHIHEAQSRAKRILDRFVEGNLLRRLREISDHIIARELPVLLPPTRSPQSPVGVVVGAIDLLYRDPQTGAFVIADYKTDEIQTKTDIVDRTRVYSLQVGSYVTAVKEALNLAEDPMSELWFLQADHIEAIR